MCAVIVPPATAPSTGPYIGLTNFSEEHAALFFGRDAERKVLISNLRASRLTLLHAESGVGKSSLLRAGVAARLREFAGRSLDSGRGPEHIPVVFSAWRDDPTAELIAQVRAEVLSLVPDADSAHADYDRLDDALRAVCAETDATVLVILDQFEEYFLYRSREEPPGRFVDELSACINALDLRANFLIAIREDAYAGLGNLFQGRIENIYGNFLRLENLTRKTAREAIERPIDRWNEEHPEERAELEPQLVDVVLRELRPDLASEQTGKGKLEATDERADEDDIPAPYLQLVMRRLWEEDTAEVPHRLRVATLERLDGAASIVRNHVDRSLSGLPQRDRDAAFDIFRYLVTPSGTKIALGAADLAALTPDSPAELPRLLERLSASDTRILRPVPPPQHGDPGNRYEITHDLLAPAILDWRAHERTRRLEQEKNAAEERVKAERQRALRFRALAIGCGLLFLVAVVLGVRACQSERDANRSEKQATEHAQAAQASRLAIGAGAAVDSDPELATLLALAALKDRPKSPEAMGALRAALPRLQLRATMTPRVPFQSVEFSRDGRRIVTSSADGTLRLWDANGRPLRAELPRIDALNDVAFSPDGRQLATAEGDGTGKVIDVASGRIAHSFRRDDGYGISFVTFSPDGRSVADSGGGSGGVWDVRTGKETATLRYEGEDKYDMPERVAFIGDGRRIVALGLFGGITLFDANSGRRLREVATGTEASEVAASPDGRQIATNGSGDPRIWPVAGGKHVRLKASAGATTYGGLAFSPDGRRVLASGDDGVVGIWDVGTRKEVRALGRGGADAAVAAAFGADGDTVATVTAGGALRLWDVNRGRARAAVHVSAGGDNLIKAALTPDSKTAATVSRYGATTIWRRPSNARGAWEAVRVLGGPKSLGTSDVAFSADSRRIATVGAGGALTVWSVVTGEQVMSQYLGPP